MLWPETWACPSGPTSTIPMLISGFGPVSCREAVRSSKDSLRESSALGDSSSRWSSSGCWSDMVVVLPGVVVSRRMGSQGVRPRRWVPGHDHEGRDEHGEEACCREHSHRHGPEYL